MRLHLCLHLTTPGTGIPDLLNSLYQAVQIFPPGPAPLDHSRLHANAPVTHWALANKVTRTRQSCLQQEVSGRLFPAGNNNNRAPKSFVGHGNRTSCSPQKIVLKKKPAAFHLYTGLRSPSPYGDMSNTASSNRVKKMARLISNRALLKEFR